jgi:Potential Monad-binding region of RPAP3
MQEFEKFFCKKFQDPMQRYTYLRLMELENYRTIFIGDFDSEMLITLMQTFLKQVIENEAFNNEVEQKFIHDFLAIVVATPNFEFSLEFLGKKEKELIAKVVTALALIPEDQRQELACKFRLQA